MFVYHIHTHAHTDLSRSLSASLALHRAFFLTFCSLISIILSCCLPFETKKIAYVYSILRSLIAHSSTKPYSVSMITRHLYTKYPSFFHSVEISFFVHSRSICYVLSLINYFIFFSLLKPL